MPLVPAAWGEVLDKITILEIKRARISGDAAQANIARELEALTDVANKLVLTDALTGLRERLRAANEALWEVEDALRDHERAQDFGPEFVRLARLVYQTNDERAALKRQINLETASAVIEEKSYSAY